MRLKMLLLVIASFVFISCSEDVDPYNIVTTQKEDIERYNNQLGVLSEEDMWNLSYYLLGAEISKFMGIEGFTYGVIVREAIDSSIEDEKIKSGEIIDPRVIEKDKEYERFSSKYSLSIIDIFTYKEKDRIFDPPLNEGDYYDFEVNLNMDNMRYLKIAKNPESAIFQFNDIEIMKENSEVIKYNRK